MEYNVDYEQVAASIAEAQKNLMDMYRTMNTISDNFKSVIYSKQNWDSPTSEFGSQQTSNLYDSVADLYVINSDIIKYMTSVLDNISQVITALNSIWR